MYISETIAAIATAPGQASIAVVRISGPDAIKVAAKVFIPMDKGRKLEAQKGYRALYGGFVLSGKIFDEGIALVFRAPASYTGEDVVELSCHGGHRASMELLHACLEAGAKPAKAGEFTKRAFLNGRLSLTQAEAVMDFINAGSQSSMQIARSAMQGSLFNAIEEKKNRLLALASHLAAHIDFPEEDVELLSREEFLNVTKQVALELDFLAEGYNRGEILRRGIKTAIIGSPNVGKSTLFNLLSGFDRAIVTSTPGTTRDVLREQIEIGGIALNISDTAGIRQAGDEIEAEGIRRSESEMEAAAFIIAVFDSSSALGRQDLELAMRCKGRLSLGIINKTDLGNAINAKAIEECFTELIMVSAHEETTKERIEEAVMRALSISGADYDGPMLANKRQYYAASGAKAALDEAINAINNGETLDIAGICLDEALAYLSELTGESVSESVIEQIFERFCVGK